MDHNLSLICQFLGGTMAAVADWYCSTLELCLYECARPEDPVLSALLDHITLTLTTKPYSALNRALPLCMLTSQVPLPCHFCPLHALSSCSPKTVDPRSWLPNLWGIVMVHLVIKIRPLTLDPTSGGKLLLYRKT